MDARDVTDRKRIPPSTPLIGLHCLVLDTETTGLNVERARILSVGGVYIEGVRVESVAELSILIDPGEPIPAESTKIHGLADTDVAGAGSFALHAPSLAAAFDGRVLIGHNIGFDLAILAKEQERAGMGWITPPALDTGLLARALNPYLPDGSLDTIAEWEIYLACLCDLSAYVAARVIQGKAVDPNEAGTLAVYLVDASTRSETIPAERPQGFDDIRSAFAARARATDWTGDMSGDAAFQSSLAALVEWAPIADELKIGDVTIVKNSMRFRWKKVRDQFGTLLDADAVIADWREQNRRHPEN